MTLSAVSNVTWITDMFLESHSTSYATISYTVASNNTGNTRTGKIKLTYGNVTADFEVTQYAYAQ